MRVKLDENLPRHLKGVLSALGHDASTAADENLLSRPDIAIAASAKVEDRVLLTLDVEFGNLKKFPPGFHPGIIVFRPGKLGPLAVNRFVESFFRRVDVERFRGCVVVVEPTRLRIRWPTTRFGGVR